MIADIAQREGSPAGGEPGAAPSSSCPCRARLGSRPNQRRPIAACRAGFLPRSLGPSKGLIEAITARWRRAALTQLWPACLNFRQRVEPPWASASALHAFLAACCARPNTPLVRQTRLAHFPLRFGYTRHGAGGWRILAV